LRFALKATPPWAKRLRRCARHHSDHHPKPTTLARLNRRLSPPQALQIRRPHGGLFALQI
jgi:hypothetical protein